MQIHHIFFMTIVAEYACSLWDPYTEREDI